MPFHRNANRASRRQEVAEESRGTSSKRRPLKRRFALFFLPEKRRPRSLGLDSDSLAARSSGELNSSPTFYSHRAYIETQTHTSTRTSQAHGTTTRINPGLTRALCALLLTYRHTYTFSVILYSDDVCGNRVLFTFSSLSFSLFFLHSLFLWISARPNCRDTRNRFCVPALCRGTLRGGGGGRGATGRYSPKVSSSRAARVSNRQIAAVRKIIVSPRTSETMRTKGADRTQGEMSYCD